MYFLLMSIVVVDCCIYEYDNKYDNNNGYSNTYVIPSDEYMIRLLRWRKHSSTMVQKFAHLPKFKRIGNRWSKQLAKRYCTCTHFKTAPVNNFEFVK